MSRQRTHYMVASSCDLFVAYVIVRYHKVIPIVVTCALKRAAKVFFRGKDCGVFAV